MMPTTNWTAFFRGRSCTCRPWQRARGPRQPCSLGQSVDRPRIKRTPSATAACACPTTRMSV
eukprot:12598452-Alexandrium_andersonii.AAC.1